MNGTGSERGPVTHILIGNHDIMCYLTLLMLIWIYNKTDIWIPFSSEKSVFQPHLSQNHTLFLMLYFNYSNINSLNLLTKIGFSKCIKLRMHNNIFMYLNKWTYRNFDTSFYASAKQYIKINTPLRNILFSSIRFSFKCFSFIIFRMSDFSSPS